MKTRVAFALILSMVALMGVTSTSTAQPAAPSAADATNSEVIGRSTEGRKIVAEYRGPADAQQVVVVLGSMHGLELAGERVIGGLRSAGLPPEVGVWLIPSMNPDGRGRQRENARGVDLNRNFPGDWVDHGRRGTPKWSGSRPASEPETRAVTEFLTKVRPAAVISFHQPFGVVDPSHERARQAAKALARDLRLPARVVNCSGPCHGTLTGWVDKELTAIAITVELPPRVSKALVRRSVKGVLRLAGALGR